ncbi:MAG: succinyldiaminopimelate transaminase [Gammaproteobacteria bacterium]|nr:succinyldiaminopimelate transaminase [Gammaproteobacteria bacterium]MCZ6762281.1 succinyldiaminopimelate transaminase [Gammaproteobacteria bacterium]
MNPYLEKLHRYPFERLALLKEGLQPPAKPHIAMSIGEPRHTPPPFIAEALVGNLDTLGSYPVALGLAELRVAAAGWLERRFGLGEDAVDPETMVLPLNGTREGLFAFVQSVVDGRGEPLVAMPNPFYQIYEGAALLAGAQPFYLNTLEENGFLPDLEAVSADTWRRTAILFLCSPGNPTGAVMDLAYLKRALELAEKHDFVIAGDECYADLYFDEDHPPAGLLQACQAMGHDRFQRCVVFHSLSKRSSVPGMRSGFVAGDPGLIKPFLLYRTYHGCAVPLFIQLASVPAWRDDLHAAENRHRYQAKLEAVWPILEPVMDLPRPQAAFYLWPRTEQDEENFTREAYRQQNLTLLPGSYLARDTADGNPGKHRVRISLVAPLADCVDAAERLHHLVNQL